MQENKFIEFKQEYAEDIKKTVIAFANCDGGTIYIGINDDGAVLGVENVDDTVFRLTNAIRDAVRPDVSMFTDCHTESIESKQVVVFSVQRGTARPYYLVGKGIRPEGVFVRQGASTVPASEAAILQMIKETAGDSYEEARSLNQQLDFENTAEYFKSRDVDFGKAQKRTLGFIGEDGTYTNLALLFSAQCPHTIKAAVFEGSKKTIFKDRLEISGPLLAQLGAAYAFIDRYNRTRSEFSGLERIDMRDYPPEAVREVLLNALVHRDYSFKASVLLSIFDDRMEFVSIGGLVKGISANDIRLGVSVLRNPKLANIFYRLKLIEAYGTGILKINECYSEYDVKPDFEISDHAFKVTLPNTNYARSRHTVYESPKKTVRGNAADERKAVLKSLLENNTSVTRKEVQDALGVSQGTASLLLQHYIEEGLLCKEGSGRYVRYRKI